MKYSTTTHKIIAIAGFFVLGCIEFILLYNTYKSENEHSFLSEMRTLNKEYARAIRNDVVMPGGQRILNRFIVPNMQELERLSFDEQGKFSLLSQKICDSAFHELKKYNNIDSLLHDIIKKQQLNKDIGYAVVIQSMDVSFSHGKTIPLYTQKEHYDHIDPAIQTQDGIRIGGGLKALTPGNLVSTISVNGSMDYSYGVAFSLYADFGNRQMMIFISMLPVLILCLVLTFVFIYRINYPRLTYSITTHKIIAIVSFLVLSSVQFFLLYNTYKLTNEHYYLTEISIINTEYSHAIRNDKVIPGGQRILDHFINPNMRRLEDLYLHDPREFSLFSQKICDSAFHVLRKANNIDSLLSTIIKRHNLYRDLEYSLLVESVDVSFQRDKFIPLYNMREHYDLIDAGLQSKDGIHIGGTLSDIYPRNLATALTVSSSVDYSYGTTFSLHVDIRNRRITILKLMMPTFLLSLLSISSVVLLFFITFRNWLRQKKLSEMKSDFINSITHEFHTPLAAIIVANKTMQNEKIISSKESLIPLTEVVQRQSERLKILISQVLEITTMNKISLQKEEYFLHHLLDEILLDYRLKLVGANVRLMLYKEAIRDSVLLDRFWFTTILLNIFDNAIKYNSSASREITVTTFNDKKGINITISDNGIGMTEEIQKHIFEKFYRNMQNSNSQVKGLGLGLFYVKQAIEAHNWKIDIESTEGKGSTFIISIPF